MATGITTKGVAYSADGVSIHYRVAGHGRTALVFVHGWCGEQGHWDEQIAAFSPNYTVVTIDIAGHGASGTNRTEWTMEAFA
jgi:pimeloyl-ACP methyl ester carboxylesterase